MTRQITGGYGMPSVAALEERIYLLERRVATLAEALKLIAGGLENPPLDGEDPAAVAAREAREILAAARLAG